MKKSYIFITIIIVALLGAYIYNLSATASANERKIEYMERKQQLQEIETELKEARKNLKLAEEQLKDAKSFKVLRSSNDKALQVKAATDIYNSWKQRVENLENREKVIREVY